MMRIKRWMLGLALAMAATAGAHAQPQDAGIYRCKVNDQTVFQDHPCAGSVITPPSGQSPKKTYDEAALERKLDHLQALGVGLIQHHPPGAQQQPKGEPLYPEGFKPVGRMTPEQYQQLQNAWTARLTAQAEHNNAVSIATLSRDEEQQQQRCGDKLSDMPSVGMTDETFRQCTTVARHGLITQVVAIDEDGMPLRLYVFPTEKIRRVYAIDGVVTAIKP